MVWCPLGPAPCSLRCLLSSLSFLLVGMFAGDVFVSVFFSLSGAGETQTHFGFGLPLVSLHPGHDLPLQSVRHAPHLHPGSRPALFFFFLGGVRVGVSRVWFSLSGLSACLSVCCLCMSALHVRVLIPRQFWREGDNHLPPPGYDHCNILGIGVRTEVPCIPCTDSVSPPPTPFLPNAVKDSPGRGWGKIAPGNRTVTHCWARMCVPPRGKCCPFFSFCVFSVRSGVSCRFLSFLLSKGRFIGKIFGSELLFLGGCVGLGFFGGFLLLLLLHFWRFAPETVRKKFSCCQVWCFFGVVLFSFGFFADVVFFLETKIR